MYINVSLVESSTSSLIEPLVASLFSYLIAYLVKDAIKDSRLIKDAIKHSIKMQLITQYTPKGKLGLGWKCNYKHHVVVERPIIKSIKTKPHGRCAIKRHVYNPCLTFVGFTIAQATQTRLQHSTMLCRFSW
jgi:hypothetical protein